MRRLVWPLLHTRCGTVPLLQKFPPFLSLLVKSFPGKPWSVLCCYSFAFCRMLYKWNHTNVVFCVCLLSLSITHLRFMQFVARVGVSFVFIIQLYFNVCLCYSWFKFKRKAPYRFSLSWCSAKCQLLSRAGFSVSCRVPYAYRSLSAQLGKAFSGFLN